MWQYRFCLICDNMFRHFSVEFLSNNSTNVVKRQQKTLQLLQAISVYLNSVTALSVLPRRILISSSLTGAHILPIVLIMYEARPCMSTASLSACWRIRSMSSTSMIWVRIRLAPGLRNDSKICPMRDIQETNMNKILLYFIRFHKWNSVDRSNKQSD